MIDAPPRPSPGALRSTVAIARLTIGEALRSRYLLAVVALGLVAMIYMAQGQAATEADRLRLLRQSIVQTIVLITTFSTLFLAAFALPTDLESRRIYTLVSKPVSRATVFLGRFVGFAALALLLAALLGVIGQLVLLLAASDGGDDTPSFDVVPRIEPTALHAWGAVDGPPSGNDRAPTLALDGPHEAGFQAMFAGLPASVATTDGLQPRLELRFSLRLRRDRHIRDEETATVVLRAPGASPADAVRQEVTLIDQARVHLDLPPSVFGTVPPGSALASHLADGGGTDTGTVATCVEVHLVESPFSVVIRPDSVALLGDPQSPVPTYGVVLLVEMVRIIFLLAVVLMLSTVLTPYTSVLGGFFVIMLTNVAGTFRSQVEDFANTLAHAQLLQYRQGRNMETSLQVGLFLFGDPNDPGSLWSVIIAGIEAVPDAFRFPVTADYVNGYVPAMADCIGASWMFGTWALAIVIAGMLFFSLREIP